MGVCAAKISGFGSLQGEKEARRVGGGGVCGVLGLVLGGGFLCPKIALLGDGKIQTRHHTRKKNDGRGSRTHS